METVLLGASSLIYVLLSCIMLFLSKLLFDKFAPFSSNVQVKEGNCTPIISFAGYIIGIVFILIGAFVGPSCASLKEDLIMYLAYSILGIALMGLSGVIVNKIILSKFNNTKEMLKDRNIGTAAVHFGFYLASGLIIATCVNGEYGGLLSTLLYYFLGMIFMFLFLKIYDKYTPYSIHEELEKDNYSVGIALAGNIIAIGLILAKATLGDIADVKESLIMYFVDLAAILLLLPGVRFVLGNVIVKSINLNEEIQKNNVAAGLMEFISIISFALIVFFMVDFDKFII